MPVYCPSCGQPSHHGSVVPGQAMICPHCTSRIAAPSSAATLPPADEAAPPPRPTEPEGVPFGRYRLIQEIGRGGMGVVWKAWDMQLGRVVALKQILVAGGLPTGRASLLVGRGERFLREARIAARLQHPGIVSVLDVGEHDGRPYYTAEFIDGDRLEERIRPRIDARQAVAWAKAIAEALYHAHAQGIIHRDVKPGNVLIDRAGRTHVMDFGLAKEVHPEGTPGARLTAEGVLMGTPQYMSPEQAAGKADRIGPASDQFALGVTLYEMIAGRLPFEGESQLDLLNAICDKEPARLVEADADVRTIVMKALEKDPAARYPTLADMAADLGRWLDGEPITARRISGVRRVVRRAMRHRATLLPALGVAIAALGVGAWAWVDSRRHAEDADAARAQRDAASGALRKAGLVQEVLARWARLADVLGTLDAAAHDTKMTAQERRTAEEAVWPRIEEFMRATPPDAEAQATMRALAGWARRLAGHESEGLQWMRDARDIDPDLPYGSVIEALVWFTVWAEDLPLPSAIIATGGIEFGPAPAEPADLIRARERAEKLLLEASSAPVWGEGLAREFRSTLDAMRAMLAGRYDEADAALTTLLAAASTQAFETDVLLARGKVRYLSKRFEDALADLDRVRQARPGAADVRYVLGTVRSALAMRRSKAGGDPRELWREAVREFDAALGMAPDTPEMRYQRGIAWMSLGESEAARGGDPTEAYKKAIDDVRRAIEAAPDQQAGPASDLEAANALGACRIGVAMALLARGADPREELLAAIAEFDRILARDDAHAAALNNRGIARMRIAEVERLGGLDPRGTCEKGVEDFTRALRMNPGSASALLNRGTLLRVWGDADEDRGQDGSHRFASSLTDLSESIRLDPENAVAWASRGSTGMSCAEREAATGIDPTASFDRAIADYGEALSRNPSDVATRNNRGNLLRARGDAEAARGEDPRATYGKAIADFDAAIEGNPRSSKAYYNRGVARLQMAAAQAKRGIDRTESYERAIADLGEALSINPGLTQVYVARGNALRGMAELEAASGKDPCGTYDRAIADFGQAMNRNPASAEAYDGRAVARAHRGDAEQERGEDPTATWEKALEDYRRASGVNPRMWGTHANRGMLLERMGRFAEAVEAYEAARAIVGDNVPELAGWIESARKKAEGASQR